MRRRYGLRVDRRTKATLLQFHGVQITIRRLRRNERTMATTMAAETVEMTARIAKNPRSNPSSS